MSGDLTGGGSTSTAKTPDVETYVGQMVGDVDVVQLNHHGSTTTSNQAFLSAMKAEVAVAQTGETNTFGHPNRETVNKYLNTPTTTGNSFAGTGVSTAVGTGPVFYQNEASPAGDDRVTQQGYTAAAAGHAGQGTLAAGDRRHDRLFARAASTMRARGSAPRCTPTRSTASRPA